MLVPSWELTGSIELPDGVVRVAVVPKSGRFVTRQEGASSHYQLDDLQYSAAVIFDRFDETVPA